MSDEDAHRLSRPLDLALCLQPKHPAIRPPLGVARLDFYSGLFLVRGERGHEWALECRTWGDPSPEAVRRWQLEAILAARTVDASVPYPMPPRRRTPANDRHHGRRRRVARRRRRSAEELA